MKLTNSSILWKWTLANGLLSGHLVLYHLNWKTFASWNYVNGKNEWEFEMFHENWSIMMTWLYVEWKANWDFYFYNLSGKKVAQTYLMDNELAGMFSVFDKNWNESVFQSQAFKMWWVN